MKQWLRYGTAALGLPFVLGSASAGAQQVAVAAAPAEIVVTALKANVAADRIGMSIQVIDADRLRRLHVDNPADLTGLVAGFTDAPSTPPIYFLRGVGFYDTSLGASPAISLSLDGVPLPYPILATGALLDLERVEVLKGPQGTVLGQNSTGGAINFVAAKPTGTFAAGARTEIASFGTLDSQAFVSGPLGEQMRARLAVRRLRSGPWQRSYTRDDQLGEEDLWSGRLQVAVDLGERTGVLLTANGFRDRGEDQAGQLIAVSSGADVPQALRAYPLAPTGDARAADWTPGTNFRRDVEFVQLSARIDHDFGFAQATSVSAWQHLDRRATLESDATALRALDVSTPGTMTIFSQEVRLAGATGPVQWLAGGVYQGETIDDALNAAFAVSSLPFSGANVRTHQRVETLAAFATANLELGEDFAIEGGLRYSTQDRRYSGCTYDDGSGTGAAYVGFIASLITGQQVSIPVGGCGTLGPNFRPAVVMGDLDEDNVSWRLGASWRGVTGLMLYANASRGYKSGAFPTIGATFYRQFETVGQESLLAYETGFKLADSASTLTATGAAFYYTYTDKQFRGKRVDPILGPLDALVSIPRSRVLGAELQLSWMPGPLVTINAGGSFLDTQILGQFRNFDAAGQAAEMGGQSFALSPRWQASIDGEFRPMLSAVLMGRFGGAVVYQGVANSGLGELALYEIPAHVVIDVHAGFGPVSERWEATLFVRNLADESYWSLVGSGPDTTYRLAARPRTFGVQLGFRY